MSLLSKPWLVGLAAATLLAAAANAQHADILVWSTEEDAGALTVTFNFDEKVRVFQNVCAAGRCLYSNTDPGLIGATLDDPTAGLFALADGTRISFEVVAIDSAVTVKFGDDRLNVPGAASRIGTAPNLHNHPAWQVLTTNGDLGDFVVAFKLTAAERYADSEVYTLALTNNLSTPTSVVDSPTPATPLTPTATPPPPLTITATSTAPATPNDACTGDCNEDTFVTVDEIVTGIAIALGNLEIAQCESFDSQDDGTVTVDEVVAAIGNALNGC